MKKTKILSVVSVVGVIVVIGISWLFGFKLRPNNGTPTPSNTVLPADTLTPTATLTFSPTPTPTIPDVLFRGIVTQPTYCHNGPNISYLGAIPLSAGTEVELLGMNSDGGDWLMIRGEDIDTCWIEANLLKLSPDIDFSKVLVLTTIITTENTACRVYPNRGRVIQTIIPKDRRIVAYGKSDLEAQWILVVPHDSTNLCWIENIYSNNFASLPIEAADFALAPTPTSTKPPVVVIVPATKKPTKDSNDPPPTTPNPVASNTPIPPTNTEPPPPPPTDPPTPEPTATLCWPPGHCK